MDSPTLSPNTLLPPTVTTNTRPSNPTPSRALTWHPQVPQVHNARAVPQPGVALAVHSAALGHELVAQQAREVVVVAVGEPEVAVEGAVGELLEFEVGGMVWAGW